MAYFLCCPIFTLMNVKLMRDRKNRRVATATRLRLKRRKQKYYGRVQIGLGIIFFLCVGILLLLFIRQLCDDAGQRQVIQEMTAAKESTKIEANTGDLQNNTDTSISSFN